jgi:hypothetical protein
MKLPSGMITNNILNWARMWRYDRARKRYLAALNILGPIALQYRKAQQDVDDALGEMQEIIKPVAKGWNAYYDHADYYESYLPDLTEKYPLLRKSN